MGIVRVQVEQGEGDHIVGAPAEFAAFVGVEEQLGVLLGVTERLAKSLIVELYEMFSVLSCDVGWGGVCSGSFLSLLRGLGAGSWRGLTHGGWRLEECGGRVKGG